MNENVFPFRICSFQYLLIIPFYRYAFAKEIFSEYPLDFFLTETLGCSFKRINNRSNMCLILLKVYMETMTVY